MQTYSEKKSNPIAGYPHNLSRKEKGNSSFAKINDTLLNPIAFQPKLAIGAPDDLYEKEADAMADKVMRMQIPEPVNFSFAKNGINRKCSECEEEETLHRKESSNDSTLAAPPIVHDVINSSGGKSLDADTRAFMEPRFNYDFSNVKIHDDELAAKSASSINALAYTSGNNVVFNSGQYNTNSDSGKKLLAHELTHVVQQRGENKNIQRVHPAIIVGAAVLAAVACAYPFYSYALSHYSNKGDKWMHCWVSCKISFYCGGPGIGSVVAVLIGAGKEVIDAALDQLGYEAHGEFADFVADLEGIGCLFSTCVDCCDEQYPVN